MFRRFFFKKQFEKAFGLPFPRMAEEQLTAEERVMAVLEDIGWQAEMARVEAQQQLDNGPPPKEEVQGLWVLWTSAALRVAGERERECRKMRRLARVAGFSKEFLAEADAAVKARGLEGGLILELF